MIKLQKDDFDQQSACEAAVSFSKNTTDEVEIHKKRYRPREGVIIEWPLNYLF